MTYVKQTETKELVASLRNKNEAAFSFLYDAYAAVLFGVAFRIVNNKSVAEELFQDVFVKIWRHINTYDEEKGSLFTWMLNITQNTCKDYLRSKQHQLQVLIEYGEFENIPIRYLPQTSCNPEESNDLQQLVQKLEPKYKEVIDLVYVAGFSQEQVSQKLNLPLGTVKTRSREALRQLKQIYSL